MTKLEALKYLENEVGFYWGGYSSNELTILKKGSLIANVYQTYTVFELPTGEMEITHNDLNKIEFSEDSISYIG